MTSLKPQTLLTRGARSASAPPLRPCDLRLHRLHGRRHLVDLHPKGLEGRVEDPREARERLDGVVQHVERYPGTYGECRLLQPLTRVGSEGIGTGQPGTVAEQREETVRLGVEVA